MADEDYKRKLTAILSADVAGYSRLMGDNEVATVSTLKSHRKLFSDKVQTFHGRVVDSPGDNILAEFRSIMDAVSCAVSIQEGLREQNDELPENRKMVFRIGVNLGDVIHDEDRIYGDGVNIAARIESLADPGGVAISGTAFDNIRNKLDCGYQFSGEHAVKNIANPVRVYKILTNPECAGKVIGEKRFWGWMSRRVAMASILSLAIIIGGLVSYYIYLHQSGRIEPASMVKMAFPLPDKPSIAVLPFDNMTGDASQEFMVDGLTETIITALARVPQLFVIARNSTFVYKGKGVKVQQVAEELGVQYVLEGSLQRSGDKLRITAQFIDALKGRHLWAAQYDLKMKDLFQLSDEVTSKILMSVYVKLTGAEEAQLHRRKGPKNTESLLKAFEVVAAMRGMNPKDNAQAKRLAEELTAMDPEFSSGYSLLARAYFMDVLLGSSNSPKESLAKALELAQKAVAMDEFNPNNYNTLGYVFSLMRKQDQALVEFEKASELCPSCSDPYMYIGYIQYCMDETDKAIASLQTALRLNPYPPNYYYVHFGNAYRHLGKYDEAISWYNKALQISPNVQNAYVGLVTVFSLLGREEEARSAARELLRLNPKFSVEHYAKMLPYTNKDKVSRYADALFKAGLN